MQPQGGKEEAIALGRAFTELQLIVSGLGSLVVILFGTKIASAALPNAYSDAAGLLSILCIGLLAFVVSSQSHLLQL